MGQDHPSSSAVRSIRMQLAFPSGWTVSPQLAFGGDLAQRDW